MLVRRAACAALHRVISRVFSSFVSCSFVCCSLRVLQWSSRCVNVLASSSQMNSPRRWRSPQRSLADPVLFRLLSQPVRPPVVVAVRLQHGLGFHWR